MRQSTKQAVLLSFFLMMISSVFAMPSDDEVANWTSNVLFTTISVSAQELKTEEKRKQVGKYYSGQAKSGIQNFFSDLVPLILKDNISTNPQPLGPPVVTRQGRLNGTPYWQVTQSFLMTSIKKKIWFSVIVIENEDPPLLIENLNIQLSD